LIPPQVNLEEHGQYRSLYETCAACEYCEIVAVYQLPFCLDLQYSRSVLKSALVQTSFFFLSSLSEDCGAVVFALCAAVIAVVFSWLEAISGRVRILPRLYLLQHIVIECGSSCVDCESDHPPLVLAPA